MCGSGTLVIGGQEHNVYLGYYGGSLDGRNVQDKSDAAAEAAREYVRAVMVKASKEELIKAFIGMLETAEE